MPEELSVREAAERLRLSPRAVRDRIADGRLTARQVPGRRGPEWRVLVDSLPQDAADEAEETAEEGGDEAAGSGGASALAKARTLLHKREAEVARLEATLEGREAVIAEKDARIADLQRVLTERQQSVARLEVLLQQAQLMLPAATGAGGQETADEAAGHGEKAASPPRSWWRWFLGRPEA